MAFEKPTPRTPAQIRRLVVTIVDVAEHVNGLGETVPASVRAGYEVSVTDAGGGMTVIGDSIGSTSTPAEFRGYIEA